MHAYQQSAHILPIGMCHLDQRERSCTTVE